MRKSLVVAAVIGLMVAIPLSVVAVTNAIGSKLDQQSGLFQTKSQSTLSSSYVNVPGLSGLQICSQNEVSVTFSANLLGGGVAFQVKTDTGQVLSPGPAFYYPGDNVSRSDSYTWVAQIANGSHTLNLQWRALVGKTITLQRGDLNVEYESGTC